MRSGAGRPLAETVAGPLFPRVLLWYGASAAATAVAVVAAVVVTATAVAAVIAAAAAEDQDQNQDDPQAVVATPTIVTTHRHLPPVRDGDRLAISVHLMPQEGECAPRGKFSGDHSAGGSFPRMVRVGLQHRSSMSDMVAAGIFNPAPQRAQVSSTEL